MLSITVTLIILVVSIAIARMIYRRVYARQIERGEEGNIFVGLMILVATCLALGFGYVGTKNAAGIDLPDPVIIETIYCADGSIKRIDDSCPCSEFDLQSRC
ncbi:hypothetical protein MAXJ12_11682 [Mesorhizobium alhagi CCNWXJ12-2]|uniref:Uncharacterized protein n=1 Tax=Mesorhizobium alhagi CCNWXJ12-2 TaxID=1107882 RepID=H0HQA6_9HYPH|nr:hypothetical protein MAXJ12_11682 [Mesorhizobium alhagi CCNWXJ12-2]